MRISDWSSDVCSSDLPDARYFSFNAYDPALRPIDGIADARIAPDAGSGNPFSDEGATSGRHYSLTVEFGKKPEVPAQNTLYSGSIMVNGALALPNPVTVLLYRIYIPARSEEHTSELQSLMRISYAVFCSKK